MPEHDSDGSMGMAMPHTGNDLLSGAQSGQQPDWAQTMHNLLELARESNANFDYTQSLKYLSDLQDIWTGKGLTDVPIDFRFELHRERGKALASLGRHEEAIVEYRTLLNHCEAPEFIQVRSETFTQIGQLLAKQGDFDRALGFLQRAINAYRRSDDTVGYCKALRNLGVVYVELGELTEAEANFQEAIDMADKTEQPVLYADLVNNMGAVQNMKGDWRAALKHYRESLTLYRANSEKRKSAYTLNNIAITLVEKQIDDEAFQYFQDANAIAEEIKDASLALIIDINLSDLYVKRHDYEQARKHCEKAENYLVKKELTNGHLVETKKLSGKIAYCEKRYEDALRQLSSALEISRSLGAHLLEAEVLRERGVVLRAMERNLDALADLETAHRLFTGADADGKRSEAEKLVASVEDLYLQIFESIAQEVDQKDEYTKGHSDRVASIALLLAKELKMNTLEQKTVVAGALLHDIGKIVVDDAILNKNGQLTDEEMREIQNHPTHGTNLLRDKEFPWDIKPIILHHHERFDGSGYPMKLRADGIPLMARLVCLADVFDALTSDRVYRVAYSIEQALRIMSDDVGEIFDPSLWPVFEALVRDGKADVVINARTASDEMYAIWRKCTSTAAAADSVPLSA